MDWLGGYSSEWTVTEVDPDTWADKSVIEGVKSVHVERDCTSDVPLLETGSIELDLDADFKEKWCRIWLTATQDTSERFPIATLLFQKSARTWVRGATSVNAYGYSVLRPVADRKLPYGYYAAKDANGANFVERILRDTTPAPVVVEGSFTISDNIVFDIGASYLDACWKVLNAGNWCMMVDGDGTIHVREKPSEAALELDSAHAALLIPGVNDDMDLSDIPNRYYAIKDNETVVVTNENPDSETSFQARGRWIDVVDSSPTLVNGETLLSYASRKLREVSTVTKRRVYTREYWPDVTVYSVVKGSLPSIGLDADMRVMMQTLECGNGVTVQETAGQEVVLV